MKSRNPQPTAMKRRGRGFTLIELMITLAIVALLAAIAVPSYRNYVIRSNRIDATSALLKIAAAQEKYFLQNNTYATNDLLDDDPPAGLGITGTDQGLYALAITAPDEPDGACPIASCWTATATPVDGQSQARDTKCTAFQINSLGQRTAKKGAADNTAECWTR